jgi:hypothetical protein
MNRIKKLLVAGLTLAVLVFGMVGCADKSVSNSGGMRYVGVELGGCNIAEAVQRSNEPQARNDTVVVSVSEESARVSVQLNYTCKSTPFDTRYEEKDGVMYMYIIDACGDTSETSDCYQRCTCCYTFDFNFNGQRTLNQQYRVVLTDPRQDQPIIFSEGVM